LASARPGSHTFGLDICLGVEGRGRGHNVETKDNTTRPKQRYKLTVLDFDLSIEVNILASAKARLLRPTTSYDGESEVEANILSMAPNGK